jgi:Ca-activated chloride channel family protein
VRDLIKESDVQIYAIGIADSGAFRDGYNGRAVIEELAEAGGGRAFFPDSVFQLEAIATWIAVELKNQYVLGYIPTNQEKDGKWRKIRVRVNEPRGMPRLSVRAKNGYFGPAK